MHASGYRKLGKTTPQRKALLRNQVTNLLYHGKIKTTETRAKEVKRIAEKLITLAIKEKDNFEEVTVAAKVAKKDANGKRVKEVVNGKKVTVYDEVQKTIKKDKASRLAAPQKVLSPMLVTLSGMAMLVKEEQSKNAHFPTLVTLLGITTLRKEVQPLNALGPILVTLSGITILVKEEQS